MHYRHFTVDTFLSIYNLPYQESRFNTCSIMSTEQFGGFRKLYSLMRWHEKSIILRICYSFIFVEIQCKV